MFLVLRTDIFKDSNPKHIPSILDIIRYCIFIQQTEKQIDLIKSILREGLLYHTIQLYLIRGTLGGNVQAIINISTIVRTLHYKIAIQCKNIFIILSCCHASSRTMPPCHFLAFQRSRGILHHVQRNCGLWIWSLRNDKLGT